MTDKEFVLSIYPDVEIFITLNGYYKIINTKIITWIFGFNSYFAEEDAWHDCTQFVMKSIERKLGS